MTANVASVAPEKPPEHAVAVSVTVIIPVYNAWRDLTGCLNAIRRQDYGGPIEIVVVDNNSEVPPPDDLLLADVVVRRCETPGSYAARNRGVGVARGDVLAFTDSDCVPTSDWLSRGVSALTRNPAASAVAGRVEVVASSVGPTAVETFERWCGFGQENYVRRGFGATVNLFVRHTCFERVGLFDEALLSNGDKEWGQRLTRAGERLLYADDAVVAHRARANLAELRTKIRRLAGGRWLAGSGPNGKMLALAGMLVPPPRPLLIALGAKPIPLRERLAILKVLGAIWCFKIRESVHLLAGGHPTRR